MMGAYQKLLNESFLEEVKSEKVDEDLYITGVFLGAEKKNRNGRIYPRDIIEREVNSFSKVIEANEALGELEHPEYTKINSREAAIKIVSLTMEGDMAYGKAKVLEYMPAGHMLAGLLKDVRMGVSSRGIGDVDSRGIVESNYHLITIDAVVGPSCPDAYVTAVNESYEWVLNESLNLFVEKRVISTPEEIERTLTPIKEELSNKVDPAEIVASCKKFFNACSRL